MWTLNPADWLRLAARRAPDRVCVETRHGSTSYAEMADAVDRLAAALHRRGLRTGDRLALVDTDTVEFLQVVLACARLGVTVAPLNVRLRDGELDDVLATVRPQALAAGPAFAPLAERAAAGSLGELRSVLLTRAGAAGPSSTGGAGLPTVADLVAEDGDPALPEVADDSLLFSLGLSSGTTGRPKVALQSHRMIKALVGNYLVETALTPDDRLYSGAPLFHVAGLGHYLAGVARGATLVLVDQFEPQAVADLLGRGRITFAVLTPTMISGLLALPAAAEVTGLRAVLYGGSAMPETLLRQVMAAWSCDFWNGFGAGTEAGGQSLLRPDDHRRGLAGEPHLLGSIGQPMHGVDLRVCGRDGVELAPGEVGELWSRSEVVMDGYEGDAGGRPPFSEDGWFRSGDLAYRDADGYLYLCGRSDEMFVRGGENIFPLEVESVLARHPAVAEVVVVGEPDDHWGMVVAAYVVPRGPEAPTLEDVRGFCRGHLATYKAPERIHVVDELPRTVLGKVRRHQVGAAR